MEGVSVLPKIPISDGNLKIILYFIIGVVIYLVLTGKLRKARSADQYQAAGKDENTNFAIGIRQGCNPSGVSFMIDFDSTYENDLMLIADQIATLEKVNTAYFNLYNENMYERLEKELSAAKFQEWLRRAQAGPTTAPVPGSVVAKDLYALRDTQIFSNSDSSEVVRTVKAGETVGKWLKTYKMTVKGVSKIYYLVSWNSFIFLNNQGFVLAADTKQV